MKPLFKGIIGVILALPALVAGTMVLGVRGVYNHGIDMYIGTFFTRDRVITQSILNELSTMKHNIKSRDDNPGGDELTPL